MIDFIITMAMITLLNIIFGTASFLGLILWARQRDKSNN